MLWWRMQTNKTLNLMLFPFLASCQKQQKFIWSKQTEISSTSHMEFEIVFAGNIEIFSIDISLSRLQWTGVKIKIPKCRRVSHRGNGQKSEKNLGFIVFVIVTLRRRKNISKSLSILMLKSWIPCSSWQILKPKRQTLKMLWSFWTKSRLLRKVCVLSSWCWGGFYPTTCTMQTFHILTGTFDLINVTCTTNRELQETFQL